MKKLLLILTFMLMGESAFTQNTDKLLKHYLGVKNALVAGDAKAAGEAVRTFYQTVKTEENFTQKADLLKAIEKLSKTGDNLEKQRGALNDVSVIIWKLVKEADVVKSPVYYQYCPMKKTYWVSEEKAIKNPYYGTSMLNCGKVTDTRN